MPNGLLGCVYFFNKSDERSLNHKNIPIHDGIAIWGDELAHWNTHTIDTTNTIDGRSVYYYANETGITTPNNASCVVLANCSEMVVSNLTLSNVVSGITIGFSSECMIENNYFEQTGRAIRLDYSDDNKIINNSITYNNYGGIERGLHLQNEIYIPRRYWN